MHAKPLMHLCSVNDGENKKTNELKTKEVKWKKIKQAQTAQATCF